LGNRFLNILGSTPDLKFSRSEVVTVTLTGIQGLKCFSSVFIKKFVSEKVEIPKLCEHYTVYSILEHL